MTGKPKDPVQLWEELKQRRVIRVITVYLAAAFALLQAADMIFPRLGFPSWSVTLVLIILSVGLIIVIILSWIYDITPDGIIKTKSLKSLKTDVNPDIEYLLREMKSDSPLSQEKSISYDYELYSENIRTFKKRGKIYNYSSIVVIFAVVILFTFSSANTVPFSKRDWVLITDFENMTKNPVFDKSLNTAFTLSLGQSRYINIFPRSRMFETLKRMKIEGRESIDDKTGREIAMREGIGVYIIPGISEVGNRYDINARIVETKSGNILHSEILRADTPDQILGKIDHLSKMLRRNLGESRYGISSQDKPLSKVTTSSLEALKQYSLGVEYHWKLDFTNAKTFYESALKIDTGFVAAKASLGNLLIEHFENDKGKELLNQAVKSIDKLTEKEKYSILSFYSIKVENDYPKGIGYVRILTKLYPDDATYHNNLGYYLQLDGKTGEALKEYKTAIKLDPTKALTYSGLINIYSSKLGNIDSALLWSKKMISDNPLNAWGYFNLGSCLVCLDSLERSIIAFLKARDLNPYLNLNLYRLSYSYTLLGLYDESLNVLKSISSNNKYDLSVNYEIGQCYQIMGNNREAKKFYSIFKQKATEIWLKQYPNLAETYITLGAVEARLNNSNASEQMIRKALSIDSTLYIRYAEVYCSQGKKAEAIAQVEKALENGYRDIYWLKANPAMLPIQQEPHFRELVKKYFKI